jgi:hypothetical protein
VRSSPVPCSPPLAGHCFHRRCQVLDFPARDFPSCLPGPVPVREFSFCEPKRGSRFLLFPLDLFSSPARKQSSPVVHPAASFCPVPVFVLLKLAVPSPSLHFPVLLCLRAASHYRFRSQPAKSLRYSSMSPSPADCSSFFGPILWFFVSSA